MSWLKVVGHRDVMQYNFDGRPTPRQTRKRQEDCMKTETELSNNNHTANVADRARIYSGTVPVHDVICRGKSTCKHTTSYQFR